MRSLPALLVEAFSADPLGGNGAAVVLLSHPAPAWWMQRLAGRLQQSETAFLWASQSGWALRWFTPGQEVALCGHATLAAVLALAHCRQLPAGGGVTFHTRSGPLKAGLLPVQVSAAPMAWIELPCHQLQTASPPEGLAWGLKERLQAEVLAFWHSTMGYQVALLPASASLARLDGFSAELTGDTRQGLVVMQALPERARGEAKVAGETADYQLRFFAPGLAIAEDSVTGSAHALVSPHWMAELKRPRVVGWQCSDRPGGMVCEAASSGMIRLTGAGHLLWEGALWAGREHSLEEPEAHADWQASCGL